MKFGGLKFGLAILLLTLPVAAQQSDPDRDEPLERAKWFYGQRADANGSLRAADRLKAFQLVQKLRQTQAKSLSTQWTLIGPQPTDPPPFSTAGRASVVAVDPRDSNVVYLGAADGGVWKSADGGLHWTPLTDTQPSLATGAIAIDPSAPNTIYVGTGEANGCSDCYYGAGILKSTDAGATWTQLPGPFIDPTGRGASIGSLAVHPTNGQILLAAVSLVDGNGIYRSNDGATTWTRVQGAQAGASVMFDPVNPNIAYASMFATGIYKSLDAGVTWTLSNGTLPLTGVDRIELAQARSQPSTLYASLNAPATAGGGLRGFYKSTDGAQTWFALPATPDYCTAQCWYNTAIAVDPKNADIVFLGGINLVRTLDGGASWSSVTNGSDVHVDQHGLGFAPSGRLYVANDGGAYRTDNPSTPGRPSWTNLNSTLAITEFYPSLAIHPANSLIALAGAQDNGTQRYSGQVTWEGVTCGDGGWTIIDPSQPTTVYAACQNIDIRKSNSNGSLGTWTQVLRGIDATDRRRFIAPLVMDPSNSQRLYFGTYRLYQTSDGAASWAAISPDVTGGGTGTVTAIGVAPSDPNTVYTGSSNLSTLRTAGYDIRVFVTRNALAGSNATWTERTTGLPQRYTTQIAVDPANAATAYVTYSGFSGRNGDTLGHVFKTTNAGVTWNDISNNLPNIPVNDIVLDPDLAGVIYLATDMGVFRSTDGGASWAPLAAGLPHVVVMAIKLHRPSRILRAATHGRSIWDLDVPLPTGTNPAPGLTSISPISSKIGDAAVTLTVLGSAFVNGASLRWNGATRPTTYVSPGQLTVTIPASDLAAAGINQITVTNPGSGISNTMNFTVTLPAAINTAGVVSAASFVNPPLSAGSIATAFGTNLAIATTSSTVVPLPFSLSSVTVRMNGLAVPLFFVAPGQVAFQIPWEYANSAQAALSIDVGSVAGVAQSFALGTASPAIFTIPPTGKGQGAIVIAVTGELRAAARGEVVSIYCTGLGSVSNRPATGAAGLDTPLSMTTTTPVVMIDGKPAQVLFSGLAPTFVGLYQVNVRVPDNAASGVVPVTIAVGSAASVAVTMVVQ